MPRPLTDKETPLRLVRMLAKEAPGVYDAMRRLEAAWKGMPDYDQRCALPIAAAYTWLVTDLGASDLEAAQMAGAITACYLWQRTPVIYDFDADLAAMLYEQAEELDDTQPIPWEILLRLPYPCVYIKAPGIRKDIDGFFAFIERDLNRNTLEMRMQVVAPDMDGTMPFALHLLPGASLAECIEDTRAVTRLNIREYVSVEEAPEHIKEAVQEDWTKLMLRLLQLALYLCAANAEVETRQEPREKASPPEAKSTKRQTKRKASDVAAYDVGVRMGAAIRRAAEKTAAAPGPVRAGFGAGTPKRPHSRRGHWHHYWTGPRSGERTLTLKWTPPTFVHAEDPGASSVVQVPVKK